MTFYLHARTCYTLKGTYLLENYKALERYKLPRRVVRDEWIVRVLT